MKVIISTLVAVLLSAQLFAQSTTEAYILHLSKEIFKWEVENKIDSLENLFHEKFVVVGSSGESQTKEQYISRLRSGNFTHNSIDADESTATVAGNTATVVGKGNFTVTVSGNKLSLHLSYIEVFTRLGINKPWKILAMHASVLQH